MPDQHFTISLRDRLLLPVCQEGARCQHRRPNGALCNAPLDARGRHAKKCAIGGGWVRRHNRLRDLCASSWTACNGVPALTEQRVPEWDREVHDGQGRTATEEAVLDVITSDPQSGHPVHVDVTITTACPSTWLPSAGGPAGMAWGPRTLRRTSANGTTWLVPPSFLWLSRTGGDPLRRPWGLSGAAGRQQSGLVPLCCLLVKVTARISQSWPGCGRSTAPCCSGATPS